LFGCYLCCSMYCLCVNVYCHWVTTQLQLINISYIADENLDPQRQWCCRHGNTQNKKLHFGIITLQLYTVRSWIQNVNLFMFQDHTDYIIYVSRRWSKWSRSLRRGSAADRLLGLRVRTPPSGHGCLFLLSVMCYQV